jgi:adenosylcobinamide kinase/adenosylcobinamide-phosphate guanylyltransferase
MFDLTKNHDRISPESQTTVEEQVLAEIRQLIQAVKQINGTLVMVTNEVGYSVVPVNHLARVYRDILGRINQRIAALSDEVYLVACGLPLQLK